MVDGLEDIHKSGLAHLDIKLGNIVLDKINRPHITDFGLSVKASQGELLDGRIYCYRGSRKYLAPEILEKKMFSPQKADIFALGVCLFYITVGGYPFKSATFEDKNYKKIYDTNPMTFWVKNRLVKKLRKTVSSSLAEFIVSLLQPDPESRPNLEEIRNNEWMSKFSENL